MPTATATIPIVDDWYKMVKNEAGDRNAGATTRKKMKMTIAATNAPTSGRANSRLDQPSLTRLDASAGAASRRLGGLTHQGAPITTRVR